MSFFALPREIRDKIYRELFVLSHPLFLFQDIGSEVVESFAPDRPLQWLALLYTNRQLQEEARTVLYTLNIFHLEDTTRHRNNLLQCFLDRIGFQNAGLLSHLCIDFPAIESAGQSAQLEIRQDDLHSLELLQERCTKLTKLELLLHGPSLRGLTEASQDHPYLIQDALLRINTQLRAISSLSMIMVRTFSRPPAPSVIESMQELGWVIA